MSINPMLYVNLEKILKRHYTKQKKLQFIFTAKNQCKVVVPNKFHDIKITLYMHRNNLKKKNRDKENPIQLVVENMAMMKPSGWNSYSDDYRIMYKETITDLDRLFSLLANGCRKLELVMGAEEV